MAEDKSKKPVKEKKVSKKTQTVRERIESTNPQPKKRIRKAVNKAKTPIKNVKKLNQKEYNIPLPNNKVGRLMQKKVRIVPKFIGNSYSEIKQVTWPGKKNTLKLTLAVFVFAIVFATIVGLLDLVLGNLFEKFIVK